MASYIFKKIGTQEITTIFDWDGSGSLEAPSGYTIELQTNEETQFISYTASFLDSSSINIENSRFIGEHRGTFSGDLSGVTYNTETFEQIINATEYGLLSRATSSYNSPELFETSSWFKIADDSTILMSGYNESTEYSRSMAEAFNNNKKNYVLTLKSNSLPPTKLEYVVKNTIFSDVGGYGVYQLDVVPLKESIKEVQYNQIPYEYDWNTAIGESWNIDFDFNTYENTGSYTGSFDGDLFIKGEKVEEVFKTAPRECGTLKYSETSLNSRELDTSYGLLPGLGFFEFDLETSPNGPLGNDQWKLTKPTKVILPLIISGVTSQQIDYEGKMFAIIEDRLAWSRITLNQLKGFEGAFKEFEILTMRYIEKRWDGALQTERYYEKNWGDKDFTEVGVSQDWLNYPNVPFFDRIGYFIAEIKQIRPTTLANYTFAPINGDEFRVCLAVKEYRKEITVITSAKKYAVPYWADKVTIYAVGAGGGGGGGAWGYPHIQTIQSLSQYLVRTTSTKPLNYKDIPLYDNDPLNYLFVEQYGVERNYDHDFNLIDPDTHGIGFEFVTGGSGGGGGTVVISEFNTKELPQGTILSVIPGVGGDGGVGVDHYDMVDILEKVDGGDESTFWFDNTVPSAIPFAMEKKIEDDERFGTRSGFLKGIITGYHKLNTNRNGFWYKYSGDLNLEVGGFTRNYNGTDYVEQSISTLKNTNVGDLKLTLVRQIGSPTSYELLDYYDSKANINDENSWIVDVADWLLGDLYNPNEQEFSFSNVHKISSPIGLQFKWFSHGWSFNKKISESNAKPKYHGKSGGDTRVYLEGTGQLLIKAEGGIGGVAGYGVRARFDDLQNDNKDEISAASMDQHPRIRFNSNIVGMNPTNPETYVIPGSGVSKDSKGKKIYRGGNGGFGIHMSCATEPMGDPSSAIKPTGVVGATSIYAKAPDIVSPTSTGISWDDTSYLKYTGVEIDGIIHSPSRQIKSTDDGYSPYYTINPLEAELIDLALRVNYDSSKGTHGNNSKYVSPADTGEYSFPGGGGGVGANWQGLDTRVVTDSPFIKYEALNVKGTVAIESTNPTTYKPFINYSLTNGTFSDQFFISRANEIQSNIKIGFGGTNLIHANLIDDYDSDGVRHTIPIGSGGRGGYASYYKIAYKDGTSEPIATNAQWNNTLPEDVSNRFGVGGGGGAGVYLKKFQDKNLVGIDQTIPTKGQDGANGARGVVVIVAEKYSF